MAFGRRRRTYTDYRSAREAAAASGPLQEGAQDRAGAHASGRAQGGAANRGGAAFSPGAENRAAGGSANGRAARVAQPDGQRSGNRGQAPHAVAGQRDSQAVAAAQANRRRRPSPQGHGGGNAPRQASGAAQQGARNGRQAQRDGQQAARSGTRVPHGGQQAARNGQGSSRNAQQPVREARQASRSSRQAPPDGYRAYRGAQAGRVVSPVELDGHVEQDDQQRSGDTRPSRRTARQQSRAAKQAQADAPAKKVPSLSARRVRNDSKGPDGQQAEFKAVRGGRRQDDASAQGSEYTSKSVGELRRADREERAREARKKTRRRLVGLASAIVVVAALAVGGVVLYNSPAFTIESVTVNGVEHLTSDEMAQLANVPADSTLLRVDADTITKRLKQSAWVEDVQINRAFPSTLEINVTEREVAAIVEIPANASSMVKKWAIAKDHIWLMPIPDANSDAAKTTSARIYEDEANALHIVDVPIGTKAEIGEMCTDANVNNALEIMTGMTTELADRIAEISAAGTAETTLILDNGVEVAFGKAEDIRDKERVVLQILEENESGVSYINVRMVETPTWRAI